MAWEALLWSRALSGTGVPVLLEGPLSVSPFCPLAWSSGASVPSAVLIYKLCVFIDLLALADASLIP